MTNKRGGTNPVMCPHCGYSFAADETVSFKTWRIEPLAGRVYYRQRPVITRMSWARLLHAIAAAAPCVVKPDALLNRLSDTEAVNLIRVMLCQMKRAMPAGVPWPVETVRGHGYRWSA